jgi:hypothetical protein
MGLKIGEKMHLVDIDENTSFIFQKISINVTFSYMYEIFIQWDINLMFL